MKILHAGLGGNREPGRHGNLQIGHFSQSRPFSSQEFFHVTGPFGLASAEEIDIFFVPHFFALLYPTHRPPGANGVISEESSTTGALSAFLSLVMKRTPRLTVHFLKDA
jgi:hypothetical protein